MAQYRGNRSNKDDLRGVPQINGGNPQQQFNSYSRNSYGSQRQYAANAGSGQYSRLSTNYTHAAVRHKGSGAKKIIITIVSVLLAILLIIGGPLLWYMGQLDKQLGSKENGAALSNVLTSVSLSKPFYVMLMGSDSREGSGTSKDPSMSGDQERSDVMMLARVDAPNRQVTLVSIPRDSPTTLLGGKQKINEAYNVGGAKQTVAAVKELTGAPISHFIEIHISGLQNVVDALGGVEVTVPIDMGYKDALTGEWIDLKAGKQILNGQQAQIFARCRHEYDGNQDAARQDSNRQLVQAIVKTLLAKPVWEIPGLVLEIAGYIDTDLNSADFMAIAMSFATGQGKMKMYSCTGPTDGDDDPETGLWLCYEDKEGWAKLMSAVDSGVDPSTVG